MSVLLVAVLFIGLVAFVSAQRAPLHVHLVLYSETNVHYQSMYALTREYYHKFTRVKTLYYTFSDTITETYVLDGDILRIRGTESLVPGILDKTLLALKYVRDAIPFSGYVIRSNISTIIDMEKLMAHEALFTFDYGGPACLLRWISPPDGIHDHRYAGLTFVSGTCILLSRRLVGRLLADESKVQRSLIDDVAMGVFFKDHCAHMVLHVFAYITIGIDNACFKMLLHSVGDDVLKHHVLGGEVLFYRNKNPEGQRAIDVAQMATVVHALRDRDSEHSGAAHVLSAAAPMLEDSRQPVVEVEHAPCAAVDSAIVFVTAFVGRARSSARVPRVPSSMYRALAFTSRETEVACGFGSAAAEAGWTVVYLDEIKGTLGETDDDSYNLSSKQPKICPHKFPEIMESRFMVWCDNKLNPSVPSAVAAFASWPCGAAAMFPKHPHAHVSTIRAEFVEATTLMCQTRYRRYAAAMLQYMADMVSEGYSDAYEPVYSPHNATGCIYWELRSEVSRDFQTEWWRHIERCGILCQLSLPFAKQAFPTAVVRTFPGSFIC